MALPPHHGKEQSTAGVLTLLLLLVQAGMEVMPLLGGSRAAASAWGGAPKVLATACRGWAGGRRWEVVAAVAAVVVVGGLRKGARAVGQSASRGAKGRMRGMGMGAAGAASLPAGVRAALAMVAKL